ncbi:DUF4245 domain-containing protein [Streptomyces sp. NPDC014894]|uniref:DUF4245 domain-containing protein n=1 Tax=unclassified Streptomyces TaxID=2593676 RepID=UPI0036FE6CD3
MAGMRGRQTIRDMILSMVAIGGVVGVIYLFLPNDDEGDPLKRVDYRVEQVTAQRAAPYPILAPQGLPEEWKATSVSYKGHEGDAWHLGFLDPDRQYVAVEQSTEARGKFIPKVTHHAENTGRTQRIGGETWQRWEGEKYNALVRENEGSITVVTGTASSARLAEMAASLESKPQPKPSAPAPKA